MHCFDHHSNKMSLLRWLDCIVVWQRIYHLPFAVYLVIYSWAQLIRECIKRHNITPHQRILCAMCLCMFGNLLTNRRTNFFFHQHQHNTSIKHTQNLDRRIQIYRFHSKINFEFWWQWPMPMCIRRCFETILACFFLFAFSTAFIINLKRNLAKCACAHKFMNALRVLSCAVCTLCTCVRANGEWMSVCTVNTRHTDAHGRIRLNRFHLGWMLDVDASYAELFRI